MLTWFSNWAGKISASEGISCYQIRGKSICLAIWLVETHGISKYHLTGVIKEKLNKVTCKIIFSRKSLASYYA